MFLEQSTTPTICLGPFIDDTDGKTAETGLTTARTYVYLSKNGGDLTQKTETTALAHDLIGHYHCLLDATDTGTLGRLRVAVHLAGSLPVWQDYMVLTHDAYQSLCGDHVVGAAAVSDIHTDVGTAITDIAAVHTHVNDLHDTDLPAVKSDTAAILTDTGTTLDAALTATAAEVTLVHAHVAEWSDGERLDLLLDDAAAGGGGLSEADVRTAVGLATANLDTQLGTLPTDAAAVNAACDSAISDAALATAASLATVDAVVDGILADTNELQTEWANGGRLDLILDAAGGSGSLDAAGVRTAIGMASANLDTQIGALGGGAGAIAWDGYTLTESDGTPIADADVWITTDGAGANVVASGRTDAFGVPRAPSGSLLYLDPGTYSVWADKVGWSFPNPDTVTVVTP